MADEASDLDPLPAGRIDRLIGPLERFLHVEAASGVVLLGCTLLALAIANSPWADDFLALWKTPLSFGLGDLGMRHSLKHWINDGLMAVFFFVIGLEVKRELAVGELRDPRRAALPLVAALGGMVVPAALYLVLQPGGAAAAGWGIPMATDIAFVVGCLALLGTRAPASLRVFVLSLAIADDIGAILVIALGYTDEIRWDALLGAACGLAALVALRRLGVRSFAVYGAVGVLVWLAFHESGVHATLAGVILGLLTPAGAYVSQGRFASLLDRARDVFYGGEWEQERDRSRKVRLLQRAARETIPPLEYLEGLLHPWVSFLIMPLFALANAGVPLRLGDFADPVALAVALGLVVGKPLGIVAFCWLALRLGLAELPQELGWRMLAGAGALAGIGFTMALFVAGLALEGALLDAAKVGILGGSALSAALGMGLLSTLPRRA